MPRVAPTTAALLAAAALCAPAAGAGAGVQHFRSPGSSASPAGATSGQLLSAARTAFRRGAGSSGASDLTPLLKELAVRLPRLRGAERRQAQSLLARPTDGAADPQGSGYTAPEAPGSPACSDHFCVHWVAVGADAPDPTDANANAVPDYVESAIEIAERSRSVEVDQLGWRPAKSDGVIGTDSGKTDIYLKQLGGTNIYGYAAPDPGQSISSQDPTVYGYLVIDNDFQKSEFPTYSSPITPLQVTLAHEFNHILQFGYDVNQDTWFLESTAVWMEGKVYPEAFDYLQYLRGWVQLSARPLTTFNGTDPNDRRNVKVYGTAVWNKWLDAQFGAGVVRGAWETSLTTEPSSFAIAAYDKSIRALGGSGFADQFDRFAAATAEWQALDSGFPEGSRYPDVARAGSLTVDAAGGTVKLNHTTYALVDVRPTSVLRIRLGMTAPAGTRAAMALVGRTGAAIGGRETVLLRALPKGGSGTVTIVNPSRFSRLTAVLVNSDAQLAGASSLTGDWKYARDAQPYYTRVSTDFTAPHVLRVSPKAGARSVSRGARVKVTFSEPVMGVSLGSLQLLASNGRAVRATVSFKQGSRVATLVPYGGLRPGARYRVKVSRTVTDRAVNPLVRIAMWRFTAAG